MRSSPKQLPVITEMGRAPARTPKEWESSPGKKPQSLLER